MSDPNPRAAAVLRAARKLIEKPERWAQGTSFTGTARCAWGAILATEHDFVDVLSAAGFMRRIVGPYIAEWNDIPQRTHAEVLAAFDKAIALAEGKNA